MQLSLNFYLCMKLVLFTEIQGILFLENGTLKHCEGLPRLLFTGLPHNMRAHWR